MLKTATFAVVHFTVAFTVVYALSGDILVSSLAGVIEPTINTIAFHYHEKAWRRYGARFQSLVARITGRASRTADALAG